ncbi:DUF222 domain-containing protein [Solicola sp. PLA-1-18]|uniref:HNH endonuclease n=1 Tax=Solicola sp. PLA-1-18 TaxID=3380532 RepID=UPI003B79F89E
MAAEAWFDAREELADVIDVSAEISRLEAARFRGVAAWAVGGTRSQRGPVRVLPGQEQMVQLGGAGSPAVPEFLAAELGPTLGLSAWAAQSLLADALSLVHRLPHLLEALDSGVAEVWKVRMVAAGTRGLSETTTRIVDCHLANPARDGVKPPIARITRSRLQQVISQYDYLDQADDESAEARTAHALSQRFLRVQHGLDGTADLTGRLSSEVAERLEQAVEDIATEMADTEDDTRPRQVRRAEALGRLVVHPGLAQTVLYVHLDHATGTWSADNLGAIDQTEAEHLVGHGNVTIKPVIDLAHEITATGYASPPRLREQLRLAQHDTCAFPYCDRRAAKRADVDHVIPYDSGGATSSENTHLLCRYHHRVKTHGRWKATKTAPGTTRWTSPTGQIFEVAHGLTTRLRT